MRTPEDVPTDPDALIRYGVVASVDLGAGTCTVTLDEDAETPALRWIAPRMGDTSAWLPPSVGEQVTVLCPGGELGAGLVLGGIVSTAHPAPTDEPTPLIKFKDGAIVSYDPDAHELLIQLPSGGTTVLASDGGIDLVGDVTLNGKLTATGDVVAGSISLQNHKHSTVKAGTDQSGGPV